MRLSINLDEDLIPEVDKRAKKFHVSRSSFIAICVSKQIQQDEMSECMPTLLEFAEKLKDFDFTQLLPAEK